MLSPSRIGSVNSLISLPNSLLGDDVFLAKSPVLCKETSTAAEKTFLKAVIKPKLSKLLHLSASFLDFLPLLYLPLLVTTFVVITIVIRPER